MEAGYHALQTLTKTGVYHFSLYEIALYLGIFEGSSFVSVFVVFTIAPIVIDPVLQGFVIVIHIRVLVPVIQNPRLCIEVSADSGQQFGTLNMRQVLPKVIDG